MVNDFVRGASGVVSDFVWGASGVALRECVCEFGSKTSRKLNQLRCGVDGVSKAEDSAEAASLEEAGVDKMWEALSFPPLTRGSVSNSSS